MRKRAGAKKAYPSAIPPEDEGPSLHIFEHRNAHIKWLYQLSDTESSNSGTQGCVFKVKIKNQIYALKVVRCPLMLL
jgi:hypothetical protein